MSDEIEANNTDELIEAMKEGFSVRLADAETKFLAVQQENVKLRETLSGLIGYASSVETDKIGWLIGLTPRINRALEAIGSSDRYAAGYGKIVKAGGE